MAIKKSKLAAPVRQTAASRRARERDASGPTETDIARRAYQLFIQRGGSHGHDQEDWLLAEHELRTIAPSASPSP